MSYHLTLSHVGVYVKDMPKMVDFYTGFLGFAVSDRGASRGGGEIVFMTRDPREHHQFVLANGRPEDMNFNIVNQLSFRVDSLGTLRELHAGLGDEDIEMLGPVSHGNALSVYFLDPEGNRIELFVDTPWHCRQPVRVPMDMNLDDKALLAWAEAEAKKQPDFMPIDDWRARQARLMH